MEQQIAELEQRVARLERVLEMAISGQLHLDDGRRLSALQDMDY